MAERPAKQGEVSDDRRSDVMPARPRQIELLSQLESIFFTNGYRSATMASLAKELRCSKRSLYELAPGRSDLFAMVVDRWATRVRRQGKDAEARESDPKRKLAAYLEPGVTETVGMTAKFLTELRDLPQARAIMEAHQRERMEHLKTILETGKSVGAFKDVHAHLVAGIWLAGIEKINEPAFLDQAGLSFSDAFAELYRLLIQGLEDSRT